MSVKHCHWYFTKLVRNNIYFIELIRYENQINISNKLHKVTRFKIQTLNTLGAETFSNFANFAEILKSLRREKFYIH